MREARPPAVALLGGPACVLGVVVGCMVTRMVVMMVMPRGGECRTRGKHHQQQGGGKNLFHGMNVAQAGQLGKGIPYSESREERVRNR